MEKTETRHMLKETEMKKIQDCMPYVFPSIVFDYYVFFGSATTFARSCFKAIF